ncbi:MAG TPA: YdbH domain-containing protein [Hyphomicrobiales bacterium]|nr:YdbH domain-containing protein [Hyphomicrobiales bacterium]
MLKKLALSLLMILCALLLTLAVALWQREPLARLVANRVLGDTGISVTELRGLQLARDKAGLARLQLLLPSGQHLTLDGIDLRFQLTSLRQPPAVQALAIASAQLNDAEDAPADDTETSPLLLSELLRTLREFPLPALTLEQLVVPQWPETLRLTLQHAPGSLQLDAAGDVLQLHGTFAQADTDAQATLAIALNRGDLTFGDVQVTLDPLEDNYALAGSVQLAFADLNALLDELHQAPLALPLYDADLHLDLAGTVADALLGTVSGQQSATFTAGLQAGSTFTLPAGLSEGLEALTLSFPERAALDITTGSGAGISGDLPLRVIGAWQAQALALDARITLGDCAWQGSSPCAIGFDGSAGLGDYGFSGLVALTAPGLGLNPGSYHLISTGLRVSGLPAAVPAFDLDAALELDAQQTLHLDTAVVLRNTPQNLQPQLRGTYQLANGNAEIQLNVPPLQFTEPGATLVSWFDDWPYPADILTGTLALDLHATWQSGANAAAPGKLVADVDATLSELGGFYDTFYFRGLDGRLTAHVENAETLTFSTPPLHLSLAGIDAGVPMENLSVDFQLDSAPLTLQLNSFRAEVLGGTLSAMDGSYALERERNDIVLHFDGLQVPSMLALAEYQGVQAEGAISGELPLTLTPNGVVVSGGTLAADAPGGSIRYLNAAAAGLQGNAGLDLVNQVLSNFQFQRLTSTIDYTPEGELLLGMQLQGHNPELGSDQPINLNLNLSDDIPALLKSLQAARNIEDFLQQQYQ